jgi:hypothetical protein
MGKFLRKVLKFIVIIIGSFLGGVFLVIQWMQVRQYIQGQVECHVVAVMEETASCKCRAVAVIGL